MVKAKKSNSRIVVPYGSGRKMANLLGVTNETVSVALSGRRQTKLTEKIRHLALNSFNGEELQSKN